MSPLRERRERAGLSITELAERAHMSLSKLSRLENGILKLKVDDLLTLAEALNCDANELLPARKLPSLDISRPSHEQ